MGTGLRIEGDRPPPFVTVAQVEQAARGALREAGARNAARVKEVLLTGRDERGFVGRKDTGQAHSLVGSTDPVVEPGVVRTVTGIGAPRDDIAAVLEDGRRPGKKAPPPDSLKPWIRRKLRNALASGLRGARVSLKDAAKFKRLQEAVAGRGRSLGKGVSARVSGVGKDRLEREVDRVAYIVSRSIGKKGVPGLHAFRRARAVMDKELPGIYARHLRRVIKGTPGPGATA